MPSQTSAIALASANQGGAGTPWSNESNALTADNTYADVVLDNGIGGPDSEVLAIYNFGFSVTGTVTHVEVTVQRKSNNAEVQDLTLRLFTDGVGLEGNDLADTVTNWPTTEGGATYGGLIALWNATSSPSYYNSSNWGIGIAAHFNGALTDTGYIDNLSITITYDPPLDPPMFPHTRPVQKTRRQTRVVSF